MLKIAMIDSGQARRSQWSVTRVTRRCAAVVRATIDRRVVACLQFAFAATVLLGHLSHVPLEGGELVSGRLHGVGLGARRRAGCCLLDRCRVHCRIRGHRHLAAIVVDVLDLFLLQLDFRLLLVMLSLASTSRSLHMLLGRGWRPKRLHRACGSFVFGCRFFCRLFDLSLSFFRLLWRWKLSNVLWSVLFLIVQRSNGFIFGQFFGEFFDRFGSSFGLFKITSDLFDGRDWV